MAQWMRFVLDSGRVNGRRLVSAERFVDWLSPQVVVPPNAFYPAARLSRPHQITYGLGWFLHDYQGQSVAMHTGSIDGMIAIIGLIPDQRLGVYVLANADHAELRHALMYRVFDMYTSGVARDWSTDLKALYDGLQQQGKDAEAGLVKARVPGTRPSLELARYAGTYADSLAGPLVITLEQGRLRARLGAGFEGWLEHWHYDTFIGTWDDRRTGRSPLTFTIGASGAVATVTFDAAGQTLTFSRQP